MASKTLEPVRDVIILGTGPSGLTAALYTARANLRPLVLHGSVPGGQLTTTTEVENFPGFPDGIDGNELIDNMTKQATKFGAEFAFGEVTEVVLDKRPFELHTSDKIYQAKALIIATGARPRKLGLESETFYWTKVRACHAVINLYRV